jgi:hypothetical protein
MKRLIGLAAICFLVVANTTVYGSYGFFGSYVAIDPDGPGGVSYTWYGMQQPGPTTLTAFNGFNLGNFTVGSTAQIAGGEGLTFKNGGSDVYGVMLDWRVDGNAFQEIALNFTANAPFNDAAGNSFTGSGDQKWANIASTPNFLSGLGVGAHTLEVYLRGYGNGADFYANNGGANYTANFNVTAAVPEPGTLFLWVGGLGILIAARRRWQRTQRL